MEWSLSLGAPFSTCDRSPIILIYRKLQIYHIVLIIPLLSSFSIRTSRPYQNILSRHFQNVLDQKSLEWIFCGMSQSFIDL